MCSQGSIGTGGCSQGIIEIGEYRNRGVKEQECSQGSKEIGWKLAMGTIDHRRSQRIIGIWV